MRVIRSSTADCRRSYVVLAFLQDISLAMEELPMMWERYETLLLRDRAIKSIFVTEKPMDEAVIAIGWTTARALEWRWGTSSEDALEQGISYAGIDYLTRHSGRDRAKRLWETYEEKTKGLDYDVRAIERQVRLKFADMTWRMLKSAERGIPDELQPLTRFLVLAANEVEEWRVWAERQWNEWARELWIALDKPDPIEFDVSRLKSASTNREREWLLSFYASFVSKAIDRWPEHKFSDELREYLTTLVQDAGSRPLDQTTFLSEYILALLNDSWKKHWQFKEMLLTTRGISRRKWRLGYFARWNCLSLNLQIIERWSTLERTRRETLISRGDLTPIAAYNDAWQKFVLAMTQDGDRSDSTTLLNSALTDLEKRSEELNQLRRSEIHDRYTRSATYLLEAIEEVIAHAVSKASLVEWFALQRAWLPYTYRIQYLPTFRLLGNDLNEALTTLGKPGRFSVGT